MRHDLLGLELDQALALLQKEAIVPQVTKTCAPKRRDESRGVWRVVYACDDASQLTVSRFLDPIEEDRQDNGC